MSFSGFTFLFLFLPLALALNFLLPKRWRNATALLSSLLFYAWISGGQIIFLLVFILVNDRLGRWIRAHAGQPLPARRRTVAAVAFNLAILVFYKLAALPWVAPAVLRQPAWFQELARYPIGISFLTFLAIAYLIDVYRRRIPGEVSLFSLSLYLALFPKVIAGPLMRYGEFAPQLEHRLVTVSAAADGARRFILGLARKVLVADLLAVLVNQVFAVEGLRLPPGLAWLGIVAFSLQIYHDFAGYSDMAIGLGLMLGFRFPENFNLPYTSLSITEFWRRWHISLSNWFRDYVFYPLERFRRSGSGYPQALNTLAVFLLTGLWHGLTPNFLIWGGIHGTAIALEQGRPGARLRSLGRLWQYCYALAVIMLGWVFFRSGSLAGALHYLASLVGVYRSLPAFPLSVMPPVPLSTWLALLVGAFFALPVFPWLVGRLENGLPHRLVSSRLAWRLLADAGLLLLFVLAVMQMAGSTYQGYIYAQF